MGTFDDLLTANEQFAATFDQGHLAAPPARKLALLTCMDSRIDPLRVLGLDLGDAKVFRNAGARSTPDALRSLGLAATLLGVERIAVIHHTGCAMLAGEDEMHRRMSDATGQPLDDWDFLAIDDADDDLRADVAAVRDCPLIPDTVEVVGWRYDVTSGRVAVVVE
jgi:carbonic anhydrase